ncbi:hypothetical protein HRG_007214 [Hirsutella rhossiliensis]|uniref:Small secreted protein n=1 Tax=Hirsutella rhossiliensis TaxID=111463 RepID=A0A9P8SHG1_9HYPO|nr:uncharacterized protein HRG_07214 [Hirsutella rhossiliensis]KAH0962134.1 hypothetical protein HRG_07214 [Hirsutella rhossiliensis]
MVRISAAVLAFAATAMTATVPFHSAAAVNTHNIHARALKNGLLFEKRQNPQQNSTVGANPNAADGTGNPDDQSTGNPKADKILAQFKASLTDDQKAAGDKVEEAVKAADASLKDDQRKMLAEVDKIFSQSEGGQGADGVDGADPAKPADPAQTSQPV